MKKVLVLGIVILLGVCFSGVVSAEPYTGSSFPAKAILKSNFDAFYKNKEKLIEIVGKFQNTSGWYHVYMKTKEGDKISFSRKMTLMRLDTGIWVFVSHPSGTPGILSK